MIRFSKARLCAAVFALSCVTGLQARAAEMAGVQLPDSQTLGTRQLQLNGMGLRTYSLFHVHIYVAGLYLAHPSRNAAAILNSDSPKILQLHFVHNVAAPQVRKAWATGLAANCLAPCSLNQAELSRFLASLNAVSAGDTVTFIFQHDKADAYENSHYLGQIADPEFAKLILAMFIGPHVQAPGLKRALLGQTG